MDHLLTAYSGIKPHAPGIELADYTIPAVQMPDGEPIMESKIIAVALEQLFPIPCAYLESPILAQVEEAWKATWRSLRPVLGPRMARECLSGPTIAWYREAREQTLGMTLEEFEERYGGEPAWEKATPYLQQLAAILKNDPSGPFCLGSTPSYADFLIVGFLEWCRCIGGGNFERICGIDSAFHDVYNACVPWLERNDH